MEIYLIRHTTPDIHKGLIYGRLDVPLAGSFSTEKEGVLQQVPPHLDLVYSSPSQRCTRLAACISAKYQVDAALAELDFGDWEGQTWDTINRADSEHWMSDFVHLSPPNGETMLRMQQRVLGFITVLLRQQVPGAAIVTHGGVIRILLAHYRSIPLKDAFSISVGMGEVIRLTVSSL